MNIPKQIKATIVYIISMLFTRGLAIITLPIFTRILTAEEIGLVTTYNSWSSIIKTIVTLSISMGAINIAMKDFSDERSEYQSSVLTLIISLSLVSYFLAWVFKYSVTKVTGLNFTLISFLIIGIVVLSTIDIWSAKKRYQYEYKIVGIVSALIALSSTVVTITAVLYFRYNENMDLGEIRIYFQNGVMLIIALFLAVRIFREGGVFYSGRYWKYAIIVSFPLMIHSLSKQILDVSDRTMISNMIGQREVGVYGTIYTLSTLALIIWAAINNALVPFMYEKLKEGKSGEESINKVVISVLVIYAGICVMVMLMGPEIIKIFATAEYYEARYLIPPVAASVFFTSLYTVYSNVVMYYKRTTYIMISTLFAAGINVCLNILFLPKYGYMAAAYTTLVSYIFLVSFHYKSMIKVHTYSFYDGKKMVVLSLVMLFVMVISLYIYDDIILRYCFIAFCAIIMGLVVKRKAKVILMLKG